MIQLLKNRVNEVIALCQKHHVDSIAVFGSAARNEMDENSDVDFLVLFSDDLNVLDYADNYFSLCEGLELITGKPIDLISVKSINNPVLLEEINRSKIELYAA